MTTENHELGYELTPEGEAIATTDAHNARIVSLLLQTANAIGLGMALRPDQQVVLAAVNRLFAAIDMAEPPKTPPAEGRAAKTHEAVITAFRNLWEATGGNAHISQVHEGGIVRYVLTVFGATTRPMDGEAALNFVCDTTTFYATLQAGNSRNGSAARDARDARNANGYLIRPEGG